MKKKLTQDPGTDSVAGATFVLVEDEKGLNLEHGDELV
jgi:hypothetical protein